MTQEQLLAATRFGAGARSVILLHGFLGSARNLRTLAQRLVEQSPDWSVLTPDLRGHGASPPLSPAATLGTLADDVLACADAAGLARPYTFIGHSLGGRVALAAARRVPDAVASITLLDISPGRIDPETSETRRVLEVLQAAPPEASDRRTLRPFFLERGLSPALSDWLLMNLATKPGGVYWAIDRAALARLHDQSMAEDLWDVVESPSLQRLPMHLIRGGRSRYVPEADLERLEAAGVPVDTLAEAGHFVHVDDLPGLLTLLREA